MKLPLKEIADMRFGLHSQSSEIGDAAYLQAKYFDDWGRMITEVDSFLILDKRDNVHLLQDGDVLFVGKGFRHFAWTYRNSFGPAVASSIFFVIKPDLSKILPEYLATVLNMPQHQSYFQQLAAGSSIPSIRKNELGEFKVAMLPFKQQEKIVELNELHQKEIELTQSIIQSKNELYQSIISKLLN